MAAEPPDHGLSPRQVAEIARALAPWAERIDAVLPFEVDLVRLGPNTPPDLAAHVTAVGRVLLTAADLRAAATRLPPARSSGPGGTPSGA